MPTRKEPTADELEREADQLAELGHQAKDRGEVEEALRLFVRAKVARRLAAAMREEETTGLPDGIAAGNNLSMRMTQEERQQQRRGRAVARARASGPVAESIVASRWKTVTAYAKRLGVAQPTLSRYLGGSLACPAEIDRAVRRDFPALADAAPKTLWPKGVVD